MASSWRPICRKPPKLIRSPRRRWRDCLDIAFNHAGVERAWVPIVKQSEEECDQTIDINLNGVWLSLKCEILHILKQGGGGTIVNMASLTGLVGVNGGSRYSASRHGVMGLTKSAALETTRNIAIKRELLGNTILHGERW